MEYDEEGHRVRYSRYGADGTLEEDQINRYDDQGNYLGYDEYDGSGNLIRSTVSEG